MTSPASARHPRESGDRWQVIPAVPVKTASGPRFRGDGQSVVFGGRSRAQPEKPALSYIGARCDKRPMLAPLGSSSDFAPRGAGKVTHFHKVTLTSLNPVNFVNFVTLRAASRSGGLAA